MPAGLLRATIKLYAESIREALAALWNHRFKPLAGIGYLIILHLAEGILGSLKGFAGGMIRGLILTLLLANFLAFIGLMHDGKRFSLEELWSRTIGIFGPLINSLFIIFIAEILFYPVLAKNPMVVGLINLGLFVLFNPLPETVSRRGSSGLQGFSDSLEFMRENGPEWLAAIVLLIGPLALMLGPASMLAVIASSDPVNAVFILLRTAMLAFGVYSAGALDLLGMLFGLYYIFFVFLARIALFEKLSMSTRRKRIYALKQ